MATAPQLTRKSSTPWERLKPVKQDPLESMGFVSKGDTRYGGGLNRLKWFNIEATQTIGDQSPRVLLQ